ncbi:hypothetical protein ElyMa_005791300 [Elysia marginata]|uniref:Uncharacterized protein n=1 Tax=Elysia marginata TaxID=1093978 RepID=A0AAV4FRS8_9GAST|nr:hypothetical protein ElyMa_005791300 [Elysia marginata]
MGLFSKSRVRRSSYRAMKPTSTPPSPPATPRRSENMSTTPSSSQRSDGYTNQLLLLPPVVGGGCGGACTMTKAQKMEKCLDILKNETDINQIVAKGFVRNILTRTPEKSVTAIVQEAKRELRK